MLKKSEVGVGGETRKGFCVSIFFFYVKTIFFTRKLIRIYYFLSLGKIIVILNTNTTYDFDQ